MAEVIRQARISFGKGISVPGFKHGGTVPGAPGEPMLAVVHGQEVISSRGQQPTIVFAGPVYGFEDFERKVQSVLVRGKRRGVQA